MASAISKRQQARNERTLQDLIRTVPGNDRCADCSAKNPGWASWNLGVFLCMRCAALHRKLGTHVSKVKSLSMDSWSSEQVENMKKVGNVAGNKTYNPQSVRAQLPVDIDEVEAAMEKYIRQKYEQRLFMTGNPAPAPAPRQSTGSTGTGSWNEEPPPLPPKPGKRFGFSLRSASSTYPRQKPDRFTPPLSPTLSGNDPSTDVPSPPKTSKASRVFGMKITSISNNFDAKLAALREMGFSDSRRNSDVLKSTSGNLDRAIEILVKMGEGSVPASESRTPGPRTLTPVSMASQGISGITFDKTRQPETKSASNNPWEIREPPQRAATQPLPQASEIPRSQSAAPAPPSWNPFLSQTQPQQPQPTLEESFQGLQVSHTGPPPQQQYAQQPVYDAQAQYQHNQQQPSSNPWSNMQRAQQIMDPMHGQQQFQQPTQVPQEAQSSNPFLRQSQSQTFAQTNPWAQAAQPQEAQQAAPLQQSSNPFGVPWQQNVFQQAATQSPAPIYGQQAEYFAQPQQSQQQPQAYSQQSFGNVETQGAYQQQQQQQVMSQMTGMPQQYQQQPQQYQQQPQQYQQQPQQYQQQPQQYQQQPQQYQQQSQQYQQQPQQYQQQPQQYSQAPAPSNRHDKSSILALYNYPQFAPSRQLQTLPEDGVAAAAPPQTQQLQQQQQRSVTMPLSQNGSMNPFAAQAPAQNGALPPGSRHVSNESVDFVGFNGNGRHSPDAFSGLSARYMR